MVSKYNLKTYIISKIESMYWKTPQEYDTYLLKILCQRKQNTPYLYKNCRGTRDINDNIMTTI